MASERRCCSLTEAEKGLDLRAQPEPYGASTARAMHLAGPVAFACSLGSVTGVKAWMKSRVTATKCLRQSGLVISDEPATQPYAIDELPIGEYAFPGALRDRLVGAILGGTKTTTSCLLEEIRRDGEPLPTIGRLEAVIDSEGRPVCVTRVTDVTVCRLADVTDEHARREGEGDANSAQWRAGHERFWASPEYVASVGEIPLDDDTEVVCETFSVVERL